MYRYNGHNEVALYLKIYFITLPFDKATVSFSKVFCLLFILYLMLVFLEKITAWNKQSQINVAATNLFT